MPAVTEEEVVEAARALAAAGEKVSVSRIRAALGHGSYSTILAILGARGIPTARARPRPPAAPGGNRLEVLRQLQAAVAEARRRNERLREAVRAEEGAALVARAVLQNLIKDIVVAHLRDPRLADFIADQDFAWLFLKNRGGAPAETALRLRAALLDDFIGRLEALKTDPGELRLSGGARSLGGALRMLADMKTRNGDDGTYEY